MIARLRRRPAAARATDRSLRRSTPAQAARRPGLPLRRQRPGRLRLLDRDDATLVCADTGGSSGCDFVLRIADGGQPRRGLHRRRLHPLRPPPADQVRLAPSRSASATSTCPVSPQNAESRSAPPGRPRAPEAPRPAPAPSRRLRAFSPAAGRAARGRRARRPRSWPGTSRAPRRLSTAMCARPQVTRPRAAPLGLAPPCRNRPLGRLARARAPRRGDGRRPELPLACVLPIVPPYLAFMAGASLDEAADRRRRSSSAPPSSSCSASPPSSCCSA